MDEVQIVIVRGTGDSLVVFTDAMLWYHCLLVSETSVSRFAWPNLVD